MKKLIFSFLLVLMLHFGHAQTFNEWFKQKQTQIEYLVQQIIALQVHIEYVQKGYQIVDQGLTAIGNIKRGDFNLHRDFFSALKNVNPKIRNSVMVADIIAMQVRIIRAQKQSLEQIRKSEQMTAKELSYVIDVYERLLQQTADNVQELTILLTANQYTLSDDERIKRIGLLHDDMHDKVRFVHWFGDQAAVLVAGRMKERADVRIGKSLLLK